MLLAVDAGIGQQIVEQFLHPGYTPMQLAQIDLGLIGQHLGRVFRNPVGQVLDRPQRRLEIVRGDVGKAIQFLVTAHQFGGSFFHPQL